MTKLIEEYNNLLSDKYDHATQGEFKWIAPLKLNQHIKPFIKNNLDVLDIGVGTGQTSKIFIDNRDNVTGIDISEKMLDLSKGKYQYKKLVKYDIEQGLVNLFPQEKFNVIVAIGILEFIEGIQKVLSDMKQLLKPGGVVAFTYEMYEPDNKYGVKKVASLGDGVENAPEILNFKVYRRTTSEIDNVLDNLSLKVINREQFVGFLKSELKIPVPYEILVVS